MAGKGGRRSTTWRKGWTPGRVSKPKGSKDRVPRSVKASIVAVIQDVVNTEPALIRQAVIDGFRARPPKSFAYLQLAAAYLDGETQKRVEITGATGGPSNWRRCRTEQLREQVRARLTKLIAAQPVIDVVPVVPTDENAGGNGHRVHLTSTG